MYSLLCFSFTSCRGQYYGKRIMHVYTLNIRIHTQNKDVWALWFFFTSNCFFKKIDSTVLLIVRHLVGVLASRVFRGRFVIYFLYCCHRASVSGSV